jgi:hypothetical protein
MGENPAVEKFFGAADFPFSFVRRLPGTRVNKTDKDLLEITTFAECTTGALQERSRHRPRVVGGGGWIKRGCDNQHPDILLTAPEVGGNKDLIACSRA